MRLEGLGYGMSPSSINEDMQIIFLKKSEQQTHSLGKAHLIILR